MSELEKCLRGEDFMDDEEIMSIKKNCRRILRQINSLDIDEDEKRNGLFRKLFATFGEHAVIADDFHCEYGRHISLGSRSIVGMNCTFVDNNYISIGSDVLIASNVQLYTAYHSVVFAQRCNPEYTGQSGQWHAYCRSRPITIGDGAWLGGGVIVLPGVSIGRQSVIGAGSVVTRSIPEHCVAFGNPCRVVRKIEETA